MTEQEQDVLAQAARILQLHCPEEEMLYSGDDEDSWHTGKDIAAVLFEQSGYSVGCLEYDQPRERPIEYSPVYVNPSLSTYARAMINLQQSSPRTNALVVGVRLMS